MCPQSFVKEAPTPPFIDRPWASPAPKPLTFIDRDPSLLSTGPWPALPPSPHFYRQEPLTFIDGARPARPPTPHFYWPTPHFYWPTPHFYWPDPSLLLARPLTSIGQTPHFYQPSQAAPCRTVSDRVGAVSAPCRTVPCQAGPCRRVGLTLAHPC